ncbi:MAG: hypothetical protein ISS16_05225 [Ignavibacteria bacterium]|nr:hypothetical protein [Bacteroidota bacterium]MBL7128371.1 hypothetical protein [Ignavibacteria bacterium]
MNKTVFVSLVLIIFAVSTSCFSFSTNLNIPITRGDTSIYADINPDRKMEIITVSFPRLKDGGIYDYVLIIDNDTTMGVFEIMDDAFAYLIDIDQSDGYREVVLMALGPSDMTDYKIFRYSEEKIIKIGDVYGFFGINTDGDGILKANEWMGFWTREQLYKLDNELMVLLPIPKDVYSLDVDVTVTKSFEILSERIDGAEVLEDLLPGTEIKLIGADTSPSFFYNNNRGYIDDYNRDWYLIRTYDGTEGWARLETFRDLVDGLIWAG